MTNRIRLVEAIRRPSAIYVTVAALLCGVGCAPRSSPQVLSIAAAADLQFALEDASRVFRAAHPGVDLRIVYGSSGNFFTQIQNQAPFDIFLSADVNYSRQLLEKHIGVPDSLFLYGLGRLAVWVPAASPLDPATALQSAAVHHLAIANPQHAPYGRAAEAALHSLGLYDRVQDKLVFGENVAQTLEFAQSGAADAGIVALSQAMAPPLHGQGRYREIPATAYPKIEQGGVIVKDSPAARDFRAWMLSPAGARVLSAYGFAIPGK